MSDLISRQDAIDAMYQLEAEDIERYGCSIPEGFDSKPAIEALKALPSVEPERKTGRWVLWNGPWSEYVKCTACGEMYGQDDLYIGGNDYPNFCPHCGADMRGE